MTEEFGKKITINSENPMVIWEDIEHRIEMGFLMKVNNFIEEIDEMPIEFYEKYQDLFNILVINLIKDMSEEELRSMFEKALTHRCSACKGEKEKENKKCKN